MMKKLGTVILAAALVAGTSAPLLAEGVNTQTSGGVSATAPGASVKGDVKTKNNADKRGTSSTTGAGVNTPAGSVSGSTGGGANVNVGTSR